MKGISLTAAGHNGPSNPETEMTRILNTWTNYLNEVAQTVIDFPVAEALAA